MKLTAIATTCAFLIAMGISHAKAKNSKDGKVDQTVTITGNDTMQFDVKTFEVKAGSKVKIVLKNIGMVPKIAMGHNIVILRKGITAFAFGQKALGAGANATNALPDSLKDDVIASTKLLGPGETDSVVMTAPSEAGTYEYVCTFPGHFALMRGVMTVK